jgi:signal transduction histidine kinase
MNPWPRISGYPSSFAAKEDIIVRGDRDLLFEAIANLVDNAVKFTPEGGQVELSLAITSRDDPGNAFTGMR